MSDQYILDENGNPVKEPDLMKWGQWFEDDDKRRVALDDCYEGVTVSTVFLGLDHSFGDGPPLLFETLISGGSRNEDMERYSTREEAIAGHKAIVDRLTPKPEEPVMTSQEDER